MKKVILTLAILAISTLAFGADIYLKADDNTLKVETVVNETRKVEFKYEYLLSQKKAIEQSIAAAQVELAKVNKMISEADKLGIDVAKSEPQEEPK